MYNKKIKTTPSTYFCRPSRVLRLFPTGCKIRYDDFFLTLHRPTKIYVKPNLQKSGSHCNLSEHACSMLTVYKSDTRILLYRQTVRRIKIDGHWNPSFMGSNLAYDRNRAVKDFPAKCSARNSEKACPVVPFATLIKIYISSFGLDFFVYDVMRSRMFTLHEVWICSFVIVWAWAF